MLIRKESSDFGGIQRKKFGKMDFSQRLSGNRN
jgi:hypothetical protein